MTKRPIQSGMLAGFVATVVLSILMVAKGVLNLLPQLSVIRILNDMMMTQGSPAAGWIVHFVIGTLLWGILFALFEPKIPGRSTVVKGIYFAIGAWLLMMVIMMPIAGAGLFGASVGFALSIVTLILHLVYGAVLGGVYGSLVYRHPTASADFWPGGGER